MDTPSNIPAQPPVRTGPLVSIIMPAYNRADYIAQAIESVLAQTYTNWELIIIDDASTDQTAEIIRSYVIKDSRIRLLQNDANRGISFTRNRGIAESNGTHIAMLDSDDFWIDDHKLEKQVEFLAAHAAEGYGLVGTGIVLVDEKGSRGRQIVFDGLDERIRGRILARNPITQSSVLFTREAYQIAGGYDPALVVSEDHDLWLHIGTTHKLCVLPHIATAYRVHSGGISKQKKLLMARTGLMLVRRWQHTYPGRPKAWCVALLRYLKAFV